MAENENLQMDNLDYLKDIENSEINALQADIAGLVDQINQFIGGQSKHTELYEYTNNKKTIEKDDGPSEKNWGQDPNVKHETSSSTSDSESETESEIEIDWSVAGPVLQKHVIELERLHSLNVATSSLIQRIQKLTRKKSMEAHE